jgi:SAM-dependent methyltransferase
VGQDSSRPQFWDTRYQDGVTPWDAAGVPAELARWLATQPAPLRVLLPGCGTGYEVRLFAGRGDDVLAIDFSAAAVQAARESLGELARHVKADDFFAFDAGTFDLVYERAFLCALPRRMWDRWAQRVAQLVRPGGQLAGFFFFDDNERGPPFGIARERLEELLGPAFELAADHAVAETESLPLFKGKERWQVWRRRL